jgi:hypothetical protein
MALVYLHYIHKSSIGGSAVSKKTQRLVNHTRYADIGMLCLDLSMLTLQYVGFYEYQIMLKVVVYSVKLKLEFFLLKILTTSLKLDTVTSVHPTGGVNSSKNVFSASSTTKSTTSVHPSEDGPQGATTN